MKPETGTKGASVVRADVVGSMLRPPELIDARSKMRAGQMTKDAYLAIENNAVDRALQIQENAKLDAVTDGEMRRDVFFGFFVSGLTGLNPLPGERIRFHSHSDEV